MQLANLNSYLDNMFPDLGSLDKKTQKTGVFELLQISKYILSGAGENVLAIENSQQLSYNFYLQHQQQMYPCIPLESVLRLLHIETFRGTGSCTIIFTCRCYTGAVLSQSCHVYYVYCLVFIRERLTVVSFSWRCVLTPEPDIKNQLTTLHNQKISF